MKSNCQISRLACRLAQWLFPFTLLACGGGSTAEYESTLALANAKEAESRSLGVDGPCATSDQCGVLYFGSATRACALPAGQVYSLVSATAKQAERAAEDQRALASRALDLAPSNDGLACPQIGTAPTPVCIASRCVAQAAR